MSALAQGMLQALLENRDGLGVDNELRQHVVREDEPKQAPLHHAPLRTIHRILELVAMTELR